MQSIAFFLLLKCELPGNVIVSMCKLLPAYSGYPQEGYDSSYYSYYTQPATTAAATLSTAPQQTPRYLS